MINKKIKEEVLKDIKDNNIIYEGDIKYKLINQAIDLTLKEVKKEIENAFEPYLKIKFGRVIKNMGQELMLKNRLEEIKKSLLGENDE